MISSETKQVTVIGAGIMGHGIAQSFLMGGFTVSLYDISKSALEVAKAHIQSSMELFHEFDLLSKEEINSSLQRLIENEDLESACNESSFIVEAVPEDIEVKRELFKRLQCLSSRNTILASNTSHLRLSDIFSKVEKKDRVIGLHYFNPAQIIPTVEVIKCRETSDEVVGITYDLMKSIKKEPVLIKQDIPGFLVNRIQIAAIREACYLYDKGVASAEDIDRAVKGSMGFRLASIGPLRVVDLGGVDDWLDACKKLLPHLRNDINPPECLSRFVERGQTGIKSGKGFYEYSKDIMNLELDDIVEYRDRSFLELLKTTTRNRATKHK